MRYPGMMSLNTSSRLKAAHRAICAHSPHLAPKSLSRECARERGELSFKVFSLPSSKRMPHERGEETSLSHAEWGSALRAHCSEPALQLPALAHKIIEHGPPYPALQPSCVLPPFDIFRADSIEGLWSRQSSDGRPTRGLTASLLPHCSLTLRLVRSCLHLSTHPATCLHPLCVNAEDLFPPSLSRASLGLEGGAGKRTRAPDLLSVLPAEGTTPRPACLLPAPAFPHARLPSDPSLASHPARTTPFHTPSTLHSLSTASASAPPQPQPLHLLFPSPSTCPTSQTTDSCRRQSQHAPVKPSFFMSPHLLPSSPHARLTTP